MNNTELEKLLKSAPVPDRAPEFWEQFPKRVTARLHWQARRDATLPVEPRWFASLLRARASWVVGAAACLVAALTLFTSRDPTRSASSSEVTQAAKCFLEIEALFPNQVRALVFDKHGLRMVLAEKADVPDSPALYLKICGPTGCQRVVTFSGQQIRVNGDNCDVLVDAAGHVLLVGEQFVWSSDSLTRAVGRYRIEARPLETSS